jgi:hypothetical protein
MAPFSVFLKEKLEVNTMLNLSMSLTKIFCTYDREEVAYVLTGRSLIN